MDTFELICHHKYDSFGGIPVDVSGCESHGRATDTTYLHDGAGPGSGAVVIATPGRVHIPISAVWQRLGGLRIEITARLDPVGGPVLPRVLIRGMDSFAFFCWKGRVNATYTKPRPDPLGGKTEGISAHFPPSQWVTFGFFHNGLDVMELSIDGEVVARRADVPDAVPGVGPEGVFIGAGGNYISHELQGAVDEVKVWRLNPYIVDMAFFSRPADRSLAECWERFFSRLAAALDRDPECARHALQAIQDSVDAFRRAVVAKGPETRERFERTTREYLKLWREGRLDSPEMARLFEDWVRWLRLVGIPLENDSLLGALRDSECLQKILAYCEPPDCDPQFAALLRRIAGACGGGDAATSA